MTEKLSNAQVGDHFEGRIRTLSLARMLAFSGGLLDAPEWPDANLHTDDDKAREAGLKSIIASGTQSEGILLELLISLFGPSWHRSGKLDAKMTSSIGVNDTIQAKARLVAQESTPQGTQIVLDVWCENGAGEKNMVGQAQGTLNAPK
jgi:acyl dehydratase